MKSFVPTGLGEIIFRDRYARNPEENWDEACRRVATHVAEAEENGNVKKFGDRFYQQLVESKFNPGGRIWYGAGRPKAQLLNCFVVPTADSREGWGRTTSDTIVISGLMGGVGMNLSPVRPRGSIVNGTGGVATGAVSFGTLIDGVGDVIAGGGGRRMALMLCLNVNHPDLEEFLTVKLDLNKLNNANISVVIPPEMSTEEFVNKVKNAEEIDLIFNGVSSGRTINAKALWDVLVENAWTSGEPGILNGFLANKMNNIFYHKPLVSTNPCLTGDTVISTVDGPRTFEQLANDGKDVLVYAWHPETKKPVIRMMRRPHKTAQNVRVLEVEFDSGLKVRCTPDHNFYSFRGEKVQAQDLKVGSSVRAWSMSEHRDGHLRVHGWDATANKAAHQWVSRMMYENFYGDIPEGMIVHHKNENKYDNHISNLEIQTVTEHNQEHYPARYAAGFDGTAKNHKVIGIREAGTADVYNGCVDDAHSYIILDPEPIAGIQSGIVSANCGEIWLEEYGCCDLGAIVLPRFVNNGEFDWDAFDETIRLGVRFLDNVLTVNHYPLPEIKENCENVRRLGLGVMGLHTMLLELGMKYDSEEAFAFVDKLFDVLKNTAYDASCNLGIEKGVFPAFSREFLNSGFAKTLKRGIRNKIKEHGLRNCALLTIAPTGTTSMTTEGDFIDQDGHVIEHVDHVSSGIEPNNPAIYERTYFKPTTTGERVRATEMVIEGAFYKYPDLIQSAVDIPVQNHFRMQQVVQKHIDNAVSKTINLANDFPKDAFGDIWLEYLPTLKGTTVYRYGSRENEPIRPIPREQWDEVLAAKNAVQGELTAEEFLALDCPDGVCEIPQLKLV